MTQDRMTFEKFKSLVASYGAGPERWPAELREDAGQFVKANAEARTLTRQAGIIDRFLDAAPVPEAAGDAFLARLHRIPNEHGDRGPVKSDGPGVIQILLDVIGYSSPRPGAMIPQAAGLFVAGLVGIMLGLSTFGVSASAERADATAYMFGNPTLGIELLELE